MSKRIVFIERDGGLCRSPATGQTDPISSIRLNENVITALQGFTAAGYSIVLLADRVSPSTATAATDAFVAELLQSQSIPCVMRHCGHGDDAGCDCALPGIGLVADDVADPGLDRSRSIVVGRGEKAVALARAMGLSGFSVSGQTGWSDIAHTVLNEPRQASVSRKTRETSITVEVDLDKAAEPAISTGIGFFDHMLEQLGKHGGFALSVGCDGDLEVDEHHTVEDVALTLGQALRQALGDKRGIGRYGFLLPMDEARAQVAVDLSGRAFSVFEGEFPRDKVGGLPTELVGHFFRSLADTLGAAIHVSVHGDNAHHMVEACFKGVARALRQAFARQGMDLPSTKGTL